MDIRCTERNQPGNLSRTKHTSSSLLRALCITILSAGLILFSSLSYAQEYETKQSSISASEYWQKLGGATSNLVTNIHSLTVRFVSIGRHDKSAFDLLFAGLLTMALFHFCVFGLRRKDISTLYFGCLCILTAVLYTTPLETSLITLFPNFDLEIANKIKLICVYLSFTMFVMFISELYPQELSHVMLRGSQSLGAFFTLLTLVTNAKIHTYIIVTYQVIVLVSSIYLIYVLIRAGLKKQGGAIWLLGAFFFLVITIINDTLFDQRIIYTGRFVPFGIFIFFFAQWCIVSYRFYQSFVTEEQITAYSRFVPKEFLKNLGRKNIADVQLGDNTEMTMSILFSDIRNFTTISEKMTPGENFKFINSYLEVMGPVIRKHHGFIDKYIGDAIMALYDRNADDAVSGAIEMLQKLVEYNEGRKRAGYFPIRIGIGINRGPLRIGTIGEQGRMEGTVIGDAVNIASRIEEMTKRYGSALLISDDTFRALQKPSNHYMRKIGRVEAKGKKEPVILWEVFDCDPPDLINYKLAIAPIFDEAVSLYMSDRFAEAQELFQDCLLKNPRDKTAQFYKDQCQLNMKMGVDGITRIISYKRLVK